MPYPQVLLFFFLSVILLLLADRKNSQVYTESETLKGLAYFLTRTAKASSMIEKFLLLFILTHPVYLTIKLGGTTGQIITGVGLIGAALTRIWIVFLIVPVVLLLTGYVVHYLFRSYSIKRFGKQKPDYDNWPEFSERADREHGSTTILVNTNSWSPIRRTTKPSLTRRAAQRSQSLGSSTRSDILGTTHRASVLPVFGTPTRSSSSSLFGGTHRSSSGSRVSGGKKGGGSGSGCGSIGVIIAALLRFLQALLMILVQVLILIALLGVAVLFAYIAYKTTEMVYDYFDEEYLIRMDE